MGSKRVFFAMLLIIALGWSVASAQAQDAPSDPPLKNSTRFPLVTLSGISAGAYFATQYQIAYSGSVQGVAIFAGGPYYCAMNNVDIALTSCMSQPELIDDFVLEEAAKGFAVAATIDPLQNLAKHNVYIFSGKRDTIVYPGVVKKLQAQYKSLGVPTNNIKTVYNVGDQHGFPTLHYGNPCNYEGSPWLNNCSYDGAGDALAWLYGTLNFKGQAVPQNLRNIPTRKFTPDGVAPSALSLGDTAFFYMPTGCQSAGQRCHVHVALHGCLQYYGKIGDVFIQNAGYNHWAESNNIIVLYPQTTASDIFPYNPQGCWDWWGYTNPMYVLKSGLQMQTVNNMINYFLSH